MHNLAMNQHDHLAWYDIDQAENIPSPALLLYPDRVRQNIRTMIRMAGNPDRLWPHVKTHKTAEILKLQMEEGIKKFKCATIAEAEMVASCGAGQVLLAIQPTGPNIGRMFRLRQKYPATEISAIADNEDTIRSISREAVKYGMETRLWLDINCGMDRTGVLPGEEALHLYTLINNLPFLKAGGLHPYDGHIHEAEISVRRKLNHDCYAPVSELIRSISSQGLPIPSVIAGGTPTMGIFSEMSNLELSPGTSVLWDQGYGDAYREMEFVPAAVLLTRVISKPNKNLITIDLGTKAIASEMPHPRVKLLGIGEYAVKTHWEEHMVIETPEAGRFRPGDVLYGIPYHICPTVARYETWHVIGNHRLTAQWPIIARNRTITI